MAVISARLGGKSQNFNVVYYNYINDILPQSCAYFVDCIWLRINSVLEYNQT